MNFIIPMQLINKKKLIVNRHKFFRYYDFFKQYYFIEKEKTIYSDEDKHDSLVTKPQICKLLT